MNLPVQVILNPETFVRLPKKLPVGGKKDFFGGRNEQFEIHRNGLIDQIQSIASHLGNNPYGSVGIVKVKMRSEALAKSHRPHTSLFTRALTPIVGGADLGEILIEATPSSLSKVQGTMEMAEVNPKIYENPKTGKNEERPSAVRCQTGAIDRIMLYSQSDRRTFSTAEAVKWLTASGTGGAYFLELFTNLLPLNEFDHKFEEKKALLQSFVGGIKGLGDGMEVIGSSQGSAVHQICSLRISISAKESNVNLFQPDGASVAQGELAPFDPDIGRHAKVLDFLDTHPLVRHIKLPPVISHPPTPSITHSSLPVQVLPGPATTHDPSSSRSEYPKIGIIDSGVSPVLDRWIIGRWDFLDPSHINYDHGTFIGGLIVHGQTLNDSRICAESDGALLYDIPLLPSESSNAFHEYYGPIADGFFEEVSSAIQEAKATHSVRVFNFSLNWKVPVESDVYGYIAVWLDRISIENDVVIFISAGNSEPEDWRLEWPEDNSVALNAIASSQNDRILQPAESIRNIAVGALNPPEVSGCIAYAPARYSRRGPGLRSGVKPDLAHVGGSGTRDLLSGHGLVSISPNGTTLTECGTSFATPLVAKTAACLLHAIDGDVARETLIALLLHKAKLPSALQHRSFKGLARDLVGFGMPDSAYNILNGDEHQITLLFSHVIGQDQEIVFEFPWPNQLVNADGGCRGRAHLTLASTPPTNPLFGAEFVRVNINAALQQQTIGQDGEESWEGRLSEERHPGRADIPAIELDRIRHGFKWAPNKFFKRDMPHGKGNTSNWRLKVSALTRFGESIPEQGISFATILTIADIDGETPIFNSMRAQLIAANVKLQDIQTTTRYMGRV